MPTTSRRSSVPAPTSACTMRSRGCRRCSATAGWSTPAIGGGRWLAERQVLVPWGDARRCSPKSAMALAGEPARSAADHGVPRAACRSRCHRATAARSRVGERGALTGAPPAVAHRDEPPARGSSVGGSVAGDREGLGCRARTVARTGSRSSTPTGSPGCSCCEGGALVGRGAVRLMGFNNPPVPWSEMERLLSDRRRPGIKPAGADGGDSPAWSRKRGPYVPPAIERPR